MTAQQFFKTYQEATGSLDVNAIAPCYADTFLFGQPEGTQPIKKEDFLAVLPKRKGFMEKIGQKKTEIVDLQETVISGNYTQVRVTWKMTYQKGEKTLEDLVYATYILHKYNDTFRIVAQFDHQDLMRRVRELGLL